MRGNKQSKCNIEGLTQPDLQEERERYTAPQAVTKEKLGKQHIKGGIRTGSAHVPPHRGEVSQDSNHFREVRATRVLRATAKYSSNVCRGGTHDNNPILRT